MTRSWDPPPRLTAAPATSITGHHPERPRSVWTPAGPGPPWGVGPYGGANNVFMTPPRENGRRFLALERALEGERGQLRLERRLALGGDPACPGPPCQRLEVLLAVTPGGRCSWRPHGQRPGRANAGTVQKAACESSVSWPPDIGPDELEKWPQPCLSRVSVLVPHQHSCPGRRPSPHPPGRHLTTSEVISLVTTRREHRACAGGCGGDG